ncbi:hypothetical protein IAQ61_002604 [Plenodomus lingam]|uniref:uncharacterized protein n=1 Tax=Leptosphaeria maculans TaxID=5022 RepID=UPI00332C69DE|nr:hypothetical protein IAQ61_002604 [Plenodomus lingam]
MQRQNVRRSSSKDPTPRFVIPVPGPIGTQHVALMATNHPCRACISSRHVVCGVQMPDIADHWLLQGLVWPKVDLALYDLKGDCGLGSRLTSAQVFRIINHLNSKNPIQCFESELDWHHGLMVRRCFPVAKIEGSSPSGVDFWFY